MTLKEHFIIGEKVYTLNLEKSKKAPYGHVGYSKRTPEGKWTTVQPKGVKPAKIEGIKKEFKKIMSLDKNMDSLKSKVKAMDTKKKGIMAELEPIFNEIDAEKIQTGKLIMTLIRQEKEILPYKELYTEAFKRLPAEAQKELQDIESKISKVSSFLTSSYGVEKSQHSELSIMIADIKESLRKYLDIKKKINATLSGGKVEKGYAETKKWDDSLESQWPTKDKDVAGEPDEELEKAKEEINANSL